MITLALQLHSLCDAKCCGDAHRGVSCAKVIVLALGHAWEATDATALTVGNEGVATTCYNLVGICLMSYIPDYTVLGCVVDIV